MQISDAPPPYGMVVFDCDSTLSAMEGIEELSGEHRAELVALTRKAMEGSLPLEAVFGARLALVEPSRSAVERIGRLYVERTLPHAGALVRALRSLGKRVIIVSGGLEPAVGELARGNGFTPQKGGAEAVRIDERGANAGFDEASPLARSGGKRLVLERRARSGAGALAFVGDGATDLEAAPCAARFIAFGGVERRASVFERARVHCEAADLAALVPLLLSADELARLSRDPAHDSLMRAAAPWLQPA
jgi:phosphoserine phosphatase